MALIVRAEVEFRGGVADALLLPDTPVEEGAAPSVWRHGHDVYVHAPDMSTSDRWVYVYARTEEPL